VVASCQRCDHYRDLAQTSIPHSAPLPATAQLPATSCLGAFWSPAASARGQSRHSGDQKPAQDETSSGPLPPCREGHVSRQEWQGPRERELEDLRLTRICANSWLLELPIWSLSSCEGTRRGSKDCDEICKCLRIKYAVPKVSSGPPARLAIITTLALVPRTGQSPNLALGIPKSVPRAISIRCTVGSRHNPVNC
jgi:hypothetical protein